MSSSPNLSAKPAKARARHLISLFIAQFAMGSGALFGRLALRSGSATGVAAARMGLVSLPLVIRHIALRRPFLGASIEARLACAALLLTAQFCCGRKHCRV